MNEVKKNKLFFIFLLSFFFIVGLGASFVLARELEIDYPTVPGVEVIPQTVEGTALPYFVKYIFNFALAIAGLAALGALIFGGVRYVTSAGDPSKLKDAKSQVFSAALGLILLLSSYLILININPQLVILKVSGLPEPEIGEPEPPADIERITSSIHMEIPVGPMIEDRIFDPARMDRIKNIAQETENEAIDVSENTNPRLRDAAEECKCEDPDVTPCPCVGNCKKVCEVICQPTLDSSRFLAALVKEIQKGRGDEGVNCAEVCWCEKVDCRCSDPPCESDPCSQVRGKIDAIKEENRKNINDLLVLEERSGLEIIDLKKEIDKLKTALQLMDNCSLSSTISLSEFISLKDYYESYDWKLKKSYYWDYIDAKRDPATFYCPVGGTTPDYLPESEIPAEEFEQFTTGFGEYIEGREEEVIISCVKPIPIGEITDRAIVVAKRIIEKIKELIEWNRKLVTNIDELHQAVSSCTSAFCNCPCDCGPVEEGCPCELPDRCNSEPCCSGEPCPMERINQLVEESKDIKKEISRIKEEIFKLIDGGTEDSLDRPTVLDEIERAKELIRPCIAEQYLEPSWLLLNCERAIGAIGPDGKVLGGEEAQEVTEEETKDCKCDAGEKCLTQDYFPELNNYQCQEVEKCLLYNSFCCRAKE
jgi:hypothetical protein